MILTSTLRVTNETHVVVPLETPRPGCDCTYLTIIHVCVRDVGEDDQVIIWPFPNPGQRRCTFQYESLTAQQLAQIPGAISLVHQVIEDVSPVQGQPLSLNAKIVSSLSEMVFVTPLDDLQDLAEDYVDVEQRLSFEYGEGYGFVIGVIPGGICVPCEFTFGWRWRGSVAFAATAWAGNRQPDSLRVVIFNTYRLQWRKDAVDDPGPARQNTLDDEPLLGSLLSVNGQTAPLKCLTCVSLRPSRWRNTDVTADRLNITTRAGSGQCTIA